MMRMSPQWPSAQALKYLAVINIALFIASSWLPDWPRLVVSNLNPMLIFGVGAFYAFRVARTNGITPRVQLAWRILGLMQAVYACGEAVWAHQELLFEQDPTYSWANVLYFTTYPLIWIGLLILPRGLRSKMDRNMLLADALIIAVAVGLFVWLAVMKPALLELQNESSAMIWAVNLGYPVADLVSIVLAASCLLRLPIGPERRALQWWAIGMVANFFGDATWVYASILDEFRTDGISSLFWLLTAWSWLLAGASRLEMVPTTKELLGPATIWEWSAKLIPMAAVAALVYAAWTIEGPSTNMRIGAMTIIAMLCLAMLRQLFSEQELVQSTKAKLQKSADARLGAIVQRSADALFVLDRNFVVRYASPGAQRVFGCDSALFLNQPLRHWIHQDDEMLVVDDLAKASMNAVRGYSTSWRMRNQQDQWLWTEATLSNLFDEPTVNGMIVCVRDVTERQELENRLRYLALHDPLTALPNRGLFEDRLAHQLAMLARSKRGLAVLFVDLDHFKLVNDNLGHEVGDHVLKQAADRLEKCMGPRDRPGRLGGDEFVVATEYNDVEDVIRLAEAIRGAIAVPFEVPPHSVQLSACIGIAYAQPRDRAEDVMHHADLAMFEVKRRGRNGFSVYDPELYRKLISHIELQNQLRDALRDGQFAVAYQPIIEAVSGQVYGVEALLRWPDRKRPALDMEALIREAENCGVIVPLGHWVMSIALRDITPLIHKDLLKSLTVNLSWRQLEHEKLPEEVEALLRDVQLAPERLVLEVTESGHLVPERSHHEMLLQLHQRGVKLALDDFGTGASSISTLQFVPMNVLKIPKHCVDDLSKPERSSRLVDALLGLAHRMNMYVVAEGVETAEQAAILRESGCRLLQGYHFARPMPIEDLRHWLARRREQLAGS